MTSSFVFDGFNRDTHSAFSNFGLFSLVRLGCGTTDNPFAFVLVPTFGSGKFGFGFCRVGVSVRRRFTLFGVPFGVHIALSIALLRNSFTYDSAGDASGVAVNVIPLPTSRSANLRTFSSVFNADFFITAIAFALSSVTIWMDSIICFIVFISQTISLVAFAPDLDVDVDLGFGNLRAERISVAATVSSQQQNAMHDRNITTTVPSGSDFFTVSFESITLAFSKP